MPLVEPVGPRSLKVGREEHRGKQRKRGKAGKRVCREGAVLFIKSLVVHQFVRGCGASCCPGVML